MTRLSCTLFLLVAGCAYSAPQPARTTAPAARGATGAAVTGEEQAPVPITVHNPTWGSRTALVTIVEYADFQCGFCTRAEPTLARIRATYGPDNVRIVWKEAPLDFHEEAHPTAEAAAAVFALAGADAFWKFHDAAFADQRDLGLDNSVKWAHEAGVADADALRQGLVSHRWAPLVDADLAEGQDLGVRGTPTFFLNGLGVVGAQPFEFFRGAIEDQMTAAKAKLASGTTPEKLYVELSRDNIAAEKKSGKLDDDEGDTKTVFKVPLGHSPVRGSADALVTIVEFADYQCPYCATAEETLKALRDEYGDKIRIVFKDEPLPFHDNAEPAAEAALQVREEKGDPAFWLMHDALFAGQNDLSEETLVRIAAQLGARPDRVKMAIEKHTHAQSIDDDLEAADDLEADGTPHFFVDGRRLPGAQPKEKFEAIIAEELKKAEDLVSKGTKPADVYDALTANGHGPPEPETKSVPASLPSVDPSRGAPHGKVTVHEWADFQCVFCARAEPTVARLLKDYGTKIKFVWHDMPLPMHPSAPLAARAAREALAQKGARAFWSLHDSIFDHQKQLGRDALDGWAHTLGLDMVKWGVALDGTGHQGEVDADAKLAEDLGVRGTPAFLIVADGATTGYFIGGAQPYPRFRKLVERSLAEAK
jgi:protein-disulfide isomerase